MADNLLTTDRTGANVALGAKDVAGVLMPRNVIVTPAGADMEPANQATAASSLAALDIIAAAVLPLDTSDIGGTVALDPATIAALTTGGGLTDAQLRAAPVPMEATGELIQALEAMRMAIQALTRTVGLTLPDTAGRMRVISETGSTVAVSSLPTLAAVTTVATVTSLTNQAQIGGFSANDELPALLRQTADNLRRNITVT